MYNYASKHHGFQYFQSSDYVTHGNKKSVLCLKSMFIFRRNVQIVFTTYLEFSRIMKNISCRTLKSYSKFLVVSLISFTDTLYNFAQTM